MSKVLRYKANEVMSCTSPYSDIMTQEVLTQGFNLHVEGRGYSMYPLIQTGDILLIEPITPAKLDNGDIVFYRRPNAMYVAHRLIKKSGSATLITKGDNLHYYDEPVPTDQVLGRVISVERDGRYQKLDSGLNKAMSRLKAIFLLMNLWFSPISKPRWRLFRRFSHIGLRGQLAFCVRKIQGISVYRKIARSLRNAVELKEIEKEDIPQVIRWININPMECTVPNEIITTGLIAKKGRRVIGYVNIVRRSKQYYPFDGYWLIGLIVKGLYRGMGIGEELTKMVIEKSKKEGAKGLSLLVSEDNFRSIQLYRKLGFKVSRNPDIEKKLKEINTPSRKQVLMFMSLDQG